MNSSRLNYHCITVLDKTEVNYRHTHAQSQMPISKKPQRCLKCLVFQSPDYLEQSNTIETSIAGCFFYMYLQIRSLSEVLK